MKPIKYPQLLDNKEVKYALNHPEPGMSCKTCSYYCLEVPLEENEKLPIQTRVDYSAEELVDLKDALIHSGFCTRQLNGSPPVILINVWSDHGCKYYEERPSWDLFVDDGMTEDDELTMPTTYY